MKISWSLISIISRFTAVGIGAIQSIILVKLLSVGDYGLINIVGAVGALVGVFQNLGISSGSTREIAAAKDKKEAFKVFMGSLFVRYAIALPLGLGLFIFAPYIGGTYYNHPEIIWPIRIFAITLFVQALQSVLNSVIQGLKEFKFLFIFQVVTAFLSILIYIPLINWFGLMGYYYALFSLNALATLISFIFVFKLFDYGKDIEIPNKKELMHIVKDVFKIGLYVYAIKILTTQWEELGPIVLGKIVTIETVGVFSFALLVGTKIMTISDAITDVTLPSMTSVYEKSRETFKEKFLNGNSKAYFLIMVATVSLILLKREGIQLADLIVMSIKGDSIAAKYAGAFAIMDPVIIGFWAHAQINLLRSGLSVPAKNMWTALTATVIMYGLTFLTFNFLNIDPVIGFSVSMAVGAVSAYVVYVLMLGQTVGFYPIKNIDILFSIISIAVLLAYYFNVSNILLAVLYGAITLFWYVKNYK